MAQPPPSTTHPGIAVADLDRAVDFLVRAMDARVIERRHGPDGAAEHVTLAIGRAQLLECRRSEPGGATAAAATICYVEDGPTVDTRYARAIDVGATAVHPPADRPTGCRSATIRDVDGNLWTLCALLADDDPKPSESLYRRLRNGYAGLSREALVEALAFHRAIVGPRRLDVEDANLALQAYLAGNPLSADQELALVMALRALRPALLISGPTIARLPARCVPSFPQWDAFVGRVRPHLRAVGRIDGPGANGALVAFGTGFLIAPDLLVTNHHVVHELSLGTGRLPPGRATVNFSWEHRQPLVDPIAVASVVRATRAGALDLAVLRLERPGCAPDECLRFATTVAQIDDRVAVVGFPAEASERNPAFVPQLFEAGLGLKRVSPGLVSQRMLGVPVFCHDAATLGGSSGSPVLSIGDGHILGVHCGGRFLDANEAIDGVTVAAWLAHLG